MIKRIYLIAAHCLIAIALCGQPAGWPAPVRPSPAHNATMQCNPSKTDNYEVSVSADICLAHIGIRMDGVPIGSLKSVKENPPGHFNWKFTLPPMSGNEVSLEFWGQGIDWGRQDFYQFCWVKKVFQPVNVLPIPVPVIGTDYYDAISPPKILEEDVPGEWTVNNPKGIILKLDSYIEYEWRFPDPVGGETVSNGKILVDSKLTSQLVKKMLTAGHTYKDAGVYSIFLNLKFVEAVPVGTSIQEIPRNYDFKKTVIVVEHIPEYLGNVLSVISEPPILKEDVEQKFELNTMFSFSRILPPDAVSLVDRFEGVEAGTITYCIDWGDGQKTAFQPYPGTEKSAIGDNPNPSVRYLNVPDLYHKYLVPGDYRITAEIIYSERYYKDYPVLDGNGQIIGYNFKIAGPFKHVAVKNVTVWDVTPPVLLSGGFEKVEATSGDQIVIHSMFRDNHPVDPIKSARLHYTVYPGNWESESAPVMWRELPADVRATGGGNFDVSAMVVIPKNFATKVFPGCPRKDNKLLQYYFEVTDAAENTNFGDKDILDNHDYQNNYGADGMDFGDISVNDNDPPMIMVAFHSREYNQYFTYEVSGGENDFISSPSSYGLVDKTCRNNAETRSEKISMEEKPVSAPVPELLTPVEFDNNLKFREDSRIFLSWKAFDTVDGELPLQSGSGLLTRNYTIFSVSGEQKADFYSFDNPNPDGSVNGRKMQIKVFIEKMTLHTKTIGDR